MKTSFQELAFATFRSWYAKHQADIDAVVFDVDGVLMIKGQPLPGAAEVIRTFRERNVPFALLTNDGCSSPEEKRATLERSGLSIHPDELVSCGHGLKELVIERDWEGQSVFLMGSLGTPCYAEQAGLNVVRDNRHIESCRAAVIGENTFDWQRELEAVLNVLIRNPSFPLLVPNPDNYFPGRDRHLHIASGALARFLQTLCRTYGAPIDPVFLGKPHEPIFRYAHSRLQQIAGHALSRRRVLLIGDSLASDIAGGRQFGYRTALVLTGITRPTMGAAPPNAPELVFQTL